MPREYNEFRTNLCLEFKSQRLDLNLQDGEPESVRASSEYQLSASFEHRAITTN